MTNNASDTKRKGIAAAKAGQASLGRLLLRRAVVEDSGAGDAWYWLSEVVEDPAQRLDCLRRALAINPADPLAHAALERLTAPREKEVPPAPDMAPLAPPVQRLPVPASVSTIIHVPASSSSAVASSTEQADAEAAPAPPGASHVSGLTTPLKKDLLNREDATPQLPAGQADTKKTQENFALSSGASARYSPRFLRVLMAFTAGALIVAGPAYYLNATGQLAVPRPLPSATIVAPTAIRPTPRPTQVLPAATRHSPVQNTPLGQATQAPRPVVSPTLSPAEQDAITAAYLRQASGLLAEKKYAEAIAALEQVVALLPEDGPAYNDRGYAYIQLAAAERSQSLAAADLRQAIADLDQAIALNSSDSTPYTNRAAAYQQLASAEPYRQTRADYRAKVVADLTQASALGDPHVTDEMLAVAHLAAGECDAALRIYDDLLANDLAIPLFAGRAAANECLGDYWPALKDIDRALNESPQNVEWMTLRAGVLRDMGLLDEALAQITKAIELDPYSGGQRYFLRATVLYDLGKTDLALKDIQRGAGNTREQWGEMFYVLGRLALADGKRSVAKDYLSFAEATLDDGPFLRRLRREMSQSGF